MKSQTLIVEEARAQIARVETEGAKALQEEKARIEELMKAAAAVRATGDPKAGPGPIAAGTTTVLAPTQTPGPKKTAKQRKAITMSKT